MNKDIERPIFIVGCGRSGTTLFYNLLAGHTSLGWFSSYIQRFPHLILLAKLNTLYQTPALLKRFHKNRGFPRPVEAHKLWDMFHPVESSLGGPPLVEKDAAVADIAGLRHFIVDILRFSGSMRFVNKNTRNTRRIRYLWAMFPDARFIHVIRDGRAVVNSLLNVGWWSNLSIWWAEGKSPAELQEEGIESVSVAARMWKSELEKVLNDKEYIPPEQYIEVRYERLAQDPITEMKHILDYCGLPWSSRFQAHIEAFDIKSKNSKWRESFTFQQIASVEKETAPLLERFGYL